MLPLSEDWWLSKLWCITEILYVRHDEVVDLLRMIKLRRSLGRLELSFQHLSSVILLRHRNVVVDSTMLRQV